MARYGSSIRIDIDVDAPPKLLVLRQMLASKASTYPWLCTQARQGRQGIFE